MPKDGKLEIVIEGVGWVLDIESATSPFNREVVVDFSMDEKGWTERFTVGTTEREKI